MTLTVCRICGNENDNPTYQVKELMFSFGDEFTYFECSSCGCLQIMDFPRDISMYYPRGYYSFSKPVSIISLSYVQSIIAQFLRQRRTSYALYRRGIIGKIMTTLFPDEAAFSLSNINLTKDTKILDVGCGSGNFLYSLKQIGFRNLLGVDKFIERDITYANGLRIRKASLEDVKGEWDIIMFNHSLEHMPNQQSTMCMVSRLLSRFGICLVNIPTVSSYAWRAYKTYWVQLDAPRHYFLHSIDSFKLLAKKAGLEIKCVLYNSTGFQFWGSEQYTMGIPSGSNRSFLRNSIFPIFSLHRLRLRQRAIEINRINQGDQAAFYLAKKGD